MPFLIINLKLAALNSDINSSSGAILLLVSLCSPHHLVDSDYPGLSGLFLGADLHL